MTAKKTTMAKKTSAKPTTRKDTKVKQQAPVSKLSALAAAAKLLGETPKALSAQRND
jgi:hypothetical protein